MPTNPYLNRRPILEAEEFVGREHEVRWLLERLAGPHPPQNCALTGLRRMGKSSLLKFLAHPEGARARYPELVHDPERLLVRYVDLSLVGTARMDAEEADTATVGALLRALRGGTGEAPRPAERVAPDAGWHRHWEALEDAVIELCDAGWQPILLFDELTNAAPWSLRLANALRSLTAHGRVAFVTASLHPLHELLTEGKMSPLYNLFSTLPLGPLPADEARRLLVEPAARLEARWSEGLVAGLLEAVGGHPDLIKMAGARLWDQWQASGSEPPATQVLEALRADADALFTSMWDHLHTTDAQAAMAALATGQPLPAGLSDLPLPATLPAAGGLPFGTLLDAWVRRRGSSEEQPRLEERWLLLGGKRHLLTQTEAGLLQLLLEQRGRTVPRETLQRAVWEEVNPKSKALDTAIQRLREKIEPDRSNPRWLLTVRGEGYSFAE